jgi:hypothetical protein
MVPMKVAGSSNGLEKVCGVPGRNRHAGAGFNIGAPVTGREAQLSLCDYEDLVVLAVNMLGWGRRTGRHCRFDETEAVLGVRAVLDDPAPDRASTRLLSVTGADHDDVHRHTSFDI